MWKLRLKKTLYILFAASFLLLAGCQSETNKQETKSQQDESTGGIYHRFYDKRDEADG